MNVGQTCLQARKGKQTDFRWQNYSFTMQFWGWICEESGLYMGLYTGCIYTSISCILHSILVAFVPMGSKSLTEIGALQWRAGQTRRKLINIKMSSHVLELHPISVLLLHFSPLRWLTQLALENEQSDKKHKTLSHRGQGEMGGR